MNQSALPSPIFVTGATGFIGRPLTQRLLEAGVDVAALVLPGERDDLPAGVRPFVGDITDAQAVRAAVAESRPAALLHLAAVGITQPGLPAAEALRVNVGGTLALLDAARAVGSVRRMVLVGSSYEYGARRCDEGLDPFNSYSASKVAAWAFARAAYNAWRAPVVWMRPFQVYGPGQRPRALIPAALRAALSGEDFQMTAGAQQRDFIFVSDVVAGLIAALTAPHTHIQGQALDLGTGALRTIHEVVAQIWALTAARGQMLAGAIPYRPGEAPAIPADAARTRRLLGWEAKTSLADGLRQTIEPLRRFRKDFGA